MQRGTIGLVVLGVLFVPVVLIGSTNWHLALIALCLIFLYHAVTSLHAALDTARLPPGPVKKCPHCQSLAPVEARVCHACGRDV